MTRGDWVSRRAVALGLTAMGASSGLMACGDAGDPVAAAPDPRDHDALLAWALSGPWRIAPERDAWRRPTQTLNFWGLNPGATVLELLPGRGWYTSILAPYLARSGGRLIVADFPEALEGPAAGPVREAFDARFADPALFGEIARVRFAEDAPLAEPGTVDLVVCARNVHTLMAASVAERVFAQCLEALKPGGVLGVVQHRAPAAGVQDPVAPSGYVQEAYVIALMESVGFTLSASSDMNANPRDDRDHPFGVWSLPPILRTAPIGEPPNPNYDTRPFEEIGESDRMTLRFTKPMRDGDEADNPEAAP